jgi:hypothetical protein
MPSLLEPERPKKKEMPKEANTRNDDEFDKLFETLRKPDDKKTNPVGGSNPNMEDEKVHVQENENESSNEEPIKKKANFSPCNKERNINDEQETSSIDENIESIEPDLDLNSSPSTPNIEDEEKFFSKIPSHTEFKDDDFANLQQLVDNSDDLKDKNKTTNLKQSKGANEVVAEENEHQDGREKLNKNVGIVITNRSPSTEDRRRHRNRSNERVKSEKDTFSKVVSDINEEHKENKVVRVDVEKDEKSTGAIKHGKENVVSKECKDLTDKTSIDKLLINENDSGISKRSNVRNEEAEEPQITSNKISITKDQSGEKIVDALNYNRQNKQKEDTNLEDQESGKIHKMQDIDKIERSTENKDCVPVKKKMKSFASVMSLFVKSKKDTSYVENPVKGRKTVKKLKKRSQTQSLFSVDLSILSISCILCILPDSWSSKLVSSFCLFCLL